MAYRLQEITLGGLPPEVTAHLAVCGERFGADASPAGRVPAEPIDQMVLAQVHAALKAPEMVQSVWDVDRAAYPEITEPDVVLPLRQHGQVWEQLFPAKRQRIVQLLIERVTLREQGIEIVWRDVGWHTLAGEMRPGTIGAELLELEQQQGAKLTTFIPVRIKRRGGRKVVVPAVNATDKIPEHDVPIHMALSRAFHWQRLIDEGIVKSGSDIALRARGAQPKQRQ